jgi:DNA-binding NarL/FixJ family response regulator
MAEMSARKQPPLTVLIAAESNEMRELLRAEFNQEPGLQIIAAASTSPEALNHFFKLKPQIVLASISLRDGSGFELLASIKRVEPRCVVVLITQHWTPFVARSGRLLGATEVCALAKDLSQIREVLRRVQTERSAKES